MTMVVLPIRTMHQSIKIVGLGSKSWATSGAQKLSENANTLQQFIKWCSISLWCQQNSLWKAFYDRLRKSELEICTWSLPSLLAARCEKMSKMRAVRSHKLTFGRTFSKARNWPGDNSSSNITVSTSRPSNWCWRSMSFPLHRRFPFLSLFIASTHDTKDTIACALSNYGEDLVLFWILEMDFWDINLAKDDKKKDRLYMAFRAFKVNVEKMHQEIFLTTGMIVVLTNWHELLIFVHADKGSVNLMRDQIIDWVKSMSEFILYLPT